MSNTTKYKTWAGFAFESLCIKHIHQIKQALGIGGIYSTESSFYSKGNDAETGFQIDMLTDRSDNAINICEMEFCATEYELSKKKPINCIIVENYSVLKRKLKSTLSILW